MFFRAGCRQNWFARPFVKMRSFAAKNWSTVEADREISRGLSRARGTVSPVGLNGLTALQAQGDCHATLPWLISA
jgi:hypothetical protein